MTGAGASTTPPNTPEYRVSSGDGEGPGSRAGRRAVAGISVWAVLGATLITLAIGAAAKSPCASGNWSDGRQYKLVCYTDIIPLLYTEQLRPEYHDRLPYLDPCRNTPGQCDEYPPVTMYVMRLVAWVSANSAGFFWLNALLLTLCALYTAWALHAMVSERALFFALAPTLLIYAFVNWDLIPVALATGGTLAHLRRRDALSGALLGLGAAAKLYPGLLVLPFLAGRLREPGGARRSARLVGAAAGVYAAVNLPFVVGGFGSWATFFKFNGKRGADWDSLWFVVCTRLHHQLGCSWSPKALNLFSALLLVASVGAVWLIRRRIAADFPRWTLGFPILALFLLTSKVYSPQYGLWLLPWFALALPSPTLFALFELTDMAVFLTRFTFFGTLEAGSAGPGDPFYGYHGATQTMFQVALLARAVVLIVCVLAWVMAGRRQAERASDAPPAAVPSSVPT